MPQGSTDAPPTIWREDRSAFTLVELLVVIGIIALLIALLLPSLAKARRQAQRTACAAKLHNLMIAAQMHRQEHGDYYPLAGLLPGYEPSGVGSNGQQVGLDDTYCKKYDYYLGGLGTNLRILCPITYALLTEMQGGKALNGPSGIMDQTSQAADNLLFLDPSGLNQNFLCPAQATSPLDIQPMYAFLWAWTGGGDSSSALKSYVCQPQSYIYNEFVLGWDDALGRLRGKGSLVHQPASTMFAADGLAGSTLALRPEVSSSISPPMNTVYNTTTLGPVSLANALTAPAFGLAPEAGDKANFDLKRHDGKINIAFCDGHVETRTINVGDLSTVWIKPP